MASGIVSESRQAFAVSIVDPARGRFSSNAMDVVAGDGPKLKSFPPQFPPEKLSAQFDTAVTRTALEVDQDGTKLDAVCALHTTLKNKAALGVQELSAMERKLLDHLDRRLPKPDKDNAGPGRTR